MAPASKPLPLDDHAIVPANDGHNSKLVADRFGDEIRYVPKVGFFVWDKQRWAPDPDRTLVSRLACRHVQILHASAEPIADDSKRRAIQKAIAAFGNGHHVTATVKLLPSNGEGIQITKAALNRKPMFLNVQNCTIDLTTGLPRLHNREDLITKLAPVTFDAKAKCPKWEKFIRAICSTRDGEPRPDLEKLLQRIVGYIITGCDTEKITIWIFGDTDTGKTTFQNLLTALLGEDEYSTEASSDPFTSKGGNEGRIVRSELADIRAVFCSEIRPNAQLDEEIFKSSAGRERVRSRGVYKSADRYRPEFKLVFLVNDLPRVNPNDNASLNRMLILPFEHKFRGNEKDVQIEGKLKKELPGILNWAIEGCLEWQKHGLDVDSVPCVVAMKQSYLRDNDTIGPVITARYELGPQEWEARTTQLHEDYEDECRERGLTPKDERAIAEWLRSHDCVDGMGGPKDGRYRVWRGLRRRAEAK